MGNIDQSPQPFWFCGLAVVAVSAAGGNGFACSLNPAHVQMKLCALTCLFGSPVLNRLQPSSGLWPGGWVCLFCCFG